MRAVAQIVQGSKKISIGHDLAAILNTVRGPKDRSKPGVAIYRLHDSPSRILKPASSGLLEFAAIRVAVRGPGDNPIGADEYSA